MQTIARCSGNRLLALLAVQLLMFVKVDSCYYTIGLCHREAHSLKCWDVHPSNDDSCICSTEGHVVVQLVRHALQRCSKQV